ncbi:MULTISPECIES: hypothetical protein [Bacillota]|jgi:hypothetical protein|nr:MULTISPECIES: hypothetical protein [Thomasclavelia]MCC2793946.1 hypothetical protein [[Clostridium] innocuum]MCC2802052.1 hypothetical protein [[Clostridium] innocuum]MCC2824519.1 hypothetical protein [[Clostridium] innocuum]MCC2842573.1 hypothetical protein [[Clostridium] innocuum]MCI3020019.1 hypothetical protein [[Clostridium] innocuum]
MNKGEEDMTEKEFLKAGKLIKQHNMDISQITKCVNLFLEESHVCEQEMVNYLARTVEMPIEVEQAFKGAFLTCEKITVRDYSDVYALLRKYDAGDKGLLLYLDTGAMMPADDMINYLSSAGYELIIRPKRTKVAAGQLSARDCGVEL